MTRGRIAAATVLGVVLITACGALRVGSTTTSSTGGSETPPATVTFRPDAPPVEPIQPASRGGAPQAGLVDPATVDGTDPAAVAIAVIATMNSWDNRTDQSRLDATHRAGRWLTSTLLADSVHVPARVDATWTALVAHDGYSVVQDIALANEYGQPSNTDTSATVQLSYVIRLVGRDGWVSPAADRRLDRIRLSRPDTTDEWLVSGFASP